MNLPKFKTKLIEKKPLSSVKNTNWKKKSSIWKKKKTQLPFHQPSAELIDPIYLRNKYKWMRDNVWKQIEFKGLGEPLRSLSGEFIKTENP